MGGRAGYLPLSRLARQVARSYGGTAMRSRLIVSCLLLVGCGPSAHNNGKPDSSVGGDANVADAAPFPDAAPTEVFPMTPIVGNGAPSNADVLFGNESIGNPGGPCIAEPSNGTLLPKNFLRQRFRLLPANGENLFEIRLRTASINHDLVAYTTSTTWIGAPADLGCDEHGANRPDDRIPGSRRAVERHGPHRPTDDQRDGSFRSPRSMHQERSSIGRAGRPAPRLRSRASRWATRPCTTSWARPTSAAA